MKQVKSFVFAIFFLAAFFVSINSFAIIFASPKDSLTTNVWMQLKVKDVVSLSAKDYCALTGRKLNLNERVVFGISKHDMKKAIKKNPDITVTQYMMDKKDMQLVWIIVLGILVILLIVVMLALLGSAG